MPIKFRCSYCRQFLGISRGRAGGVVDCPTCGRSIRVPGLDGEVLPVPAPELNRQDVKLMRALDELANWEAPQRAVIAADAAPDDEAESPQLIAEPIPIEVPVAPDPIAIQPPMVEATREAGSLDSRSEAVPPLNVAQALEELQQLADSNPAPAAGFDRSEASSRSASKGSRLPWILLALAMTAAAFLGGYMVANQNFSTATPAEQPLPEAAAIDPPPAAIPAAAIAGRISYHTSDGSSLPDRGARVLVLPREREGEAMLPVAGFRVGDHPADVRLATAAMQALGGDYAIADDGGRFQIRLPNPGTFHIVAISRYAERGDDVVDPELTRLLAQYFDQPAQLLGRTQTEFGQVRYKGTGAEIWDHAF